MPAPCLDCRRARLSRRPRKEGELTLCPTHSQKNRQKVAKHRWLYYKTLKSQRWSIAEDQVLDSLSITDGFRDPALQRAMFDLLSGNLFPPL